MSNNPYRRHGPPSSGSHPNQGNGYYRNNGQYHHNSRNMNPNHNYQQHQPHGYSRNHYSGYGNGYNSRHGTYHQPQQASTHHPNSRYHQTSPFTQHQQQSPQQQSQQPYADSNNGGDYGYLPHETSNTSNNPNSEQQSFRREPEKVVKNVFSSRRRSDEEKPTIVKTKTSSFNPLKTLSASTSSTTDLSKKGKVLDIKSLQPMKKSKVENVVIEKEPEQKNIGIDLFETKSSRSRSVSSTDIKSKLYLENKKSVSTEPLKIENSIDEHHKREDNNVNNKKDFVEDVKIESVRDDYTPAKKEILTNFEDDMKQSNSENSKIDNTNVDEKTVVNKETDVKDLDDEEDDDEDQIIAPKKRGTYAETESKKIVESEDDTDHEDSIPVPSKKSRKLHRLLKGNSENSEVSESEPKLMKKIRTKDSQPHSNKQRKSSRSNRDASGRTLLQRMCAKGNVAEVKRLVEENIDVNDADFAGITPLHEAALEGYLEIVELLVKNGANVNVQSGQMDKDTPLIDAVSNIHYKVVKFLLKKGANPLIENAQNENAMDVLKKSINEYDEDDGSDDDDREEKLKSAKKIKKLLNLHAKNFDAPKSGKTKQIEKEVSDDDLGLSYATLRTGGLDSLFDKIRANDVTFVLNYVSSAAGNKIPPEALILASKLGFPDIASLLIAFGADINYKDKLGNTPLMHAMGKEHIEMVKLLLSNQVDLRLKDNKGRTALDILEERGLTESEDYRLIKQKVEENEPSVDRTKNNTEKDKANDGEDVPEDEDEEDNEVDDDEDDESIPYVDSSYVEPDFEPHVSKKHKLEDDESEKGNTTQESMNEQIFEANRSVENISVMDEHSIKKPKLLKDDIRSPSPLTVIKKSAKPKREEVEEKKIIDPTPEELEAKRLKEIEAEKAREALEHQRNERKKLKQQEIAKRIDAFEKQREEEKRAEEREELEKKRKEEEEQSKILKMENEKKKREIIKQESEKRKLIRSYYPYELKYSHFNGEADKTELANFLPLYVFKIGTEDYIVDLQLYVLLDTEDLNTMLPNINTKRVRQEDKKSLWGFLWPRIGSFRNQNLDTNGLLKEYNNEGEKFNELLLNWIKLEDLKQNLQDCPLKEYLDSGKAICKAELGQVREPEKITVASNQDESKISSPFAISGQVPEGGFQLPLRYGKKARDSLRLVKQNLW